MQRSFAVEAADGNRDALRLSRPEPAGILLGKVLGVAGQLLVLEVVLLVGVAVLYGTDIDGVALLARHLPGRHRRAGRRRLPLRRPGRRPAGPRHAPAPPAPAGLAPVLIAATRAFEDALGTVGVDGWAWVNLLLVFAVAYVVLALACAATLLEDS